MLSADLSRISLRIMRSGASNIAERLNDLQQRILSDRVCPQLAARATQLVFGAGSPTAELLFVGEAPGKNEDTQGVPFVGAAGKLLDEMLASIHLSRGDVYITNIVKYRPPNNRDPKPSEISAFLPYLHDQISIIKPALIITLGRHSMNCLLPDMIISQVHGQPQRHQGQLYLPLYHPAAALYNGGLRQTLFEDFAVIPKLLKTAHTA
jgi:uracil-DNA glycosylase